MINDSAENDQNVDDMEVFTYHYDEREGTTMSQNCNNAKVHSLYDLISINKDNIFRNLEPALITDQNFEISTITDNKITNLTMVNQHNNKEYVGNLTSNKLQMNRILEEIQTSINQLKITHSFTEKQISKDLEQIDSILFNRDKILQIYSRTTNNLSVSDLQRLQIFLIYILEQITSLNGTIFDAESHMNELKQFRDLNIEEREKEEEDIISVEELSWDGDQSVIEKKIDVLKLSLINENVQPSCRPSSDKETQVTMNQLSDIFNDLTYKKSSKMNEECNKEDSITTNSKEYRQNIRNNGDKSNSFNEIKKRFESFNISQGTAQSFKKDGNMISNNEEKETNTIPPRENGAMIKNVLVDHDCSLNDFNEIIDDTGDNSAFLVSSIDSMCNSLSCHNPDINNNKFSERFKVNYLKELQEKNETSQMYIDAMPEISIIDNKRSHFKEKIIIKNEIEHYVDIDRGNTVSPGTSFMCSPYVKSKRKCVNNTKSLSSEQGPLKDKMDKVIIKSAEVPVEKEASFPVKQCLNEMMESEKSYLQDLYILSQILCTRIKAANIISSKNFDLLFPECLHNLWSIHKTFYDQLCETLQNGYDLDLQYKVNCKIFGHSKNHTIKIGRIFLENFEKDNWNIFTQYRQYFSRSKVALNMFERLKNQSQKFNRLIKNLEHNESCNGFDLGHFLLLPLQRLPKYLILMRKILDQPPSNPAVDGISILAVEQLIHCFLKEMNTKRASLCPNDNEVVNDSRNTSLKCNSLNGVIKYVFPNIYRDNEDKCEYNVSGDKNMHTYHSRGLHSPSESLLPSDGKLDSKLLKATLAKDSINNCKLLAQVHSIKSLNNINKIEEMSPYCIKPDSQEATNNKELNLSYKEKHFNKLEHKNVNVLAAKKQVLQSRSNVANSVSIPTQKILDTESIKSLTADECSICLNSQDEFEVDTSIDDDETCMGTMGSKIIHSTLPIKHKKSAPLSQTSVKSHIIEFCTDSKPKSQSVDTSCTNHVVKSPIEVNKPYSWLSTLVYYEAEVMIRKKVDNVVIILSHVVMELCIDESQQKLSLSTNDTNRLHSWSNSPTHYNHVTLTCTKENILSGEKNIHKKFSIKHLFSMKRRGRMDQSTDKNITSRESDTHTPVRSSSRVSLCKKLSILSKRSTK